MARRRVRDAKVESLRESRTLNPRPEAVVDEAFMSSEFFDPRDLVQVKYEMVRKVRQQGATVSAAAVAFGFSRQSFYQAAAAVVAEGLAGLVPAKPGPRRGHKLTDEVLDYVAALADEDPALRSIDLARAIAERFDIQVHPRSVERALARRQEADRSTKRP